MVHGIAAMAEDLGAYDAASIASVPADAVVGFIVSTFGEGDPPDNAADLDDCLSKWRAAAEGSGSLMAATLRYFAFGLGNSKYQHYNRFVDNVDKALATVGARRLGTVGKKDDAVRSDTSWVAWKAEIVSQLLESVPRKAAASVKSIYEPELELLAASGATIMANSLLAKHEATILAVSNTKVHAAPVSATRVLSSSGPLSERTYIHIEFDISDARSQLAYSSGDHVAVWPPNSDLEVRRLARLFAWNDSDLTGAVRIRTRTGLSGVQDLPTMVTSRDSLLRFYLDISGPVLRESAVLIEHFAPTPEARACVHDMLSDQEAWNRRVVTTHLTIGAFMEEAEPRDGVRWPPELFSLLLQVMPRLQPRYFSVASSPLVSDRKLAITVGVVTTELPSGGQFCGLATHFLQGLQQPKRGSPALVPRDSPSPIRCAGGDDSDSVSNPDIAAHLSNALLHIRPSSFKLPSNLSRPVIMIAAGSGIAPFVAFAQEREALYKAGRKVARTMLFFGCRAEEQDYLYSVEWSRLRQYEFFDIHTAYSRTGPRKEYVQHVLERRGMEVRRMILEDGATCYICGSVWMAIDVKRVLLALLAEGLGSIEKAKKHIEQMKSTRGLQEDVWA